MGSTSYPESCTHTRHVVVEGPRGGIRCLPGTPLSVTLEPGERIISGGVYRPGQDDALDPPNMDLANAPRPETDSDASPYVRRFKRPASKAIEPVEPPPPDVEPEPEPEPEPTPVDPYEPEPVDPTPIPDDTLPDPVVTDPGFVQPTIDEFLFSLAENGEGAKNLPNDGYTAQNGTTGAYGRWQTMPRNWRDWSSRALDIDYDLTRASKTLPVAEWYPMARGDREQGRANQNTVVKWKVQQYWNQTGGNCQRIAGVWFSGYLNPSNWSERTIRYVNRVCVPLGYEPLPLPV